MTAKPTNLQDLLGRLQNLHAHYGVDLKARIVFDVEGQKYVIDSEEITYGVSEVKFTLVKDDTVKPLKPRTGKCEHCHNTFNFYPTQYHSPWRSVDMEEGIFLQLTCPHCLKQENYYFKDEDVPDHVDLSNVMITAP